MFSRRKNQSNSVRQLATSSITRWLMGVSFLLLTHSASAAISLFDDASSQTQNNYALGRSTYIASGTLNVNYTAGSAGARGSRDYSVNLNYNVSTSGNFVVFIDSVSASSANLSSYSYLSFWIRGASGGENCTVGLGNGSPWFETSVKVSDLLPNGITTQWQKAVLPFSALRSRDSNFSATTINRVVIGMYQGMGGSESGNIYVDDLTFGAAAAPMPADNFNDGANPNIYNVANSGWGTNFNSSYQAVTYTGQAPYIFACDYSTGSAGGGYAFRLYSVAGDGINLTGCTDVRFDIMGQTGGETPGLRLHTGPGADYSVNLGTYATVSNQMFQTVTIPLTAFTSPANLTKCAEFDFDIGSGQSSILYVDNLQFIDTSAIAAPTNIQFGGASLYEGAFINGSSGTLSAQVSALDTDARMEGTKFEYSPDSGATWVTIGDDYNTNTTETTASANWNISGLTAGVYPVRVSTWHVGGTGSAVTYNVHVNQGTATATMTVTLTPSFTTTPSVTTTQTSTATATETVTPSSTITLTETQTSTVTTSPTATDTSTNTLTPTPTPTVTATGTGTATFTATPTRTATATATMTTTATESVTITSTSTATPSLTITHTPTFTRTATESATLTITNTLTGTPTATRTSTITTTMTTTPTATLTPSITMTATISQTPTASLTGTQTSTITVTSTISPTRTITPTLAVTMTSTASPIVTVPLSMTPTLASIPDKNDVQLGLNCYRPLRDPSLTIRIAIKQTGKLRVIIYNRLGEEIMVLKDGEEVAGRHDLFWDGKNHNQKLVASGIYLLYVEGPELKEKRTFAVVK